MIFLSSPYHQPTQRSSPNDSPTKPSTAKRQSSIEQKKAMVEGRDDQGETTKNLEVTEDHTHLQERERDDQEESFLQDEEQGLLPLDHHIQKENDDHTLKGNFLRKKAFERKNDTQGKELMEKKNSSEKRILEQKKIFEERNHTKKINK